MAKNHAPTNVATQDEDLPQTAVKPRAKDLLLQQMQNKLAEYEDTENKLGDEAGNNAEEPDKTEENPWQKRYSDLRRFAAKKETSFSKEINELKSKIKQLTDAQNQPLPKTREEFEDWKAKYPDIVGFIEIIAEERAAAAKTQVVQELETVKSKLTEAEKEKALATLKLLVPDLNDILGSDEYKTWFGNQPHFVQETLNTSDDPHQIAYYMNIFKDTSQTESKPKTKKDRLEALATSVKSIDITPSPNSGKYLFSESQIAKMSTAEFTKHEEDIIAARNAGKILNDLSNRRNSVFDV